MVNIRSPCSASVPLLDQGFYPRTLKKLPSVFSQEVTAYFMSASVANCLPARGFLKGSKEMDISGCKIKAGPYEG
jgi:hypothetical protein